MRIYPVRTFLCLVLGTALACTMQVVPPDPEFPRPADTLAVGVTLTPRATVGDFRTYTVQATSLNVRLGPGTRFEVLEGSQLSFGQSIVANCRVEGIVGWCAVEGQYVKRGELCPNRLCWVYAACLGLPGECEEAK